MTPPIVHYTEVDLQNEWMQLAYNIAKDLYQIKKWNEKTTPVAVIVSPSGKYVSHGVTANGRHAIFGECKRMEKGLPYNACPWCGHEEHAEMLALKKTSKCLLNHHLYLYGHYHSCENCIKELHKRGIYKIHILKDAKILFDRHNKHTVLKGEKQFKDNV